MRRTLLAILLMLTAVPGGAATLRLSGAAPSFTLEAVDLPRIAALDLTLDYDPAALKIEGFTAGPLLQGSLSEKNSTAPGKFRLGAVAASGISGSGVIGILQVRPLVANPAPAFVLSARIHDLEGKSLPVATVVAAANTAAPQPVSPVESAPAVPGPQREPEVPAPTGSGVSRRSAVVVYPVAGIASPAAIPPIPPRPLPPTPPSAIAPEPRRETAATNRSLPAGEENVAQEGEKEEFPADSPIERFAAALPRIKTLKDIEKALALPAAIHQQPFPALSDGKTPVTVLIDERSGKPSIAVESGRIVASESGAKGLWIDLLPWPGAVATRLLVLGDKVQDLEIVVAPPVSVDASAELLPWRDLDGDGTVTVEEAYVVAVNLLAAARQAEPRRP